MENEIKTLWVDKYRPKTIDEYVLSPELKMYFTNMIKNKSLQNMTFLGVQGCGKTTLAKILCNEFNAETLFVKCSTEGTVDTLRTKITEFCNAMTYDGRIKIIILDEIDSASSSGDNNFQKGLRTLIESAQDDTRFILTANYNKIIPAILSRCPIIPLKYDKKDLLIYIKKILDAEKITYTKTDIKEFIENSFLFYPDCRRILNYLQLCSNSGKLIFNLNKIINRDRDEFIKDIVEKCLSETNILNVRQYYLNNKSKISDFLEAGSLLFNFVIDNNIIKNSDDILKLTDLLYQLNVCVDKEPQFFAMLVIIGKYNAKV